MKGLQRRLRFLFGRPKRETESLEVVARKVRDFASYRFIKGSGIEIGALNHPLNLYRGAQVRYVDRLTRDEARRAYPDLAEGELVDVDLIEDGETLSAIAEASCDFVIANHLLEHCRNPIATIENMLRVLRPDGVLFLAVPDKRFTFDARRSITSYEHLRRDYKDGPEISDAGHYQEKTGRPLEGDDQAKRLAEFFAERTNIHFHVWTQREIVELFLNVKRDFAFPIELEMVARNGAEIVVIVRKADFAVALPQKKR